MLATPSLVSKVVKATPWDVWMTQGTRVGGRQSSQCRGREMGVVLGCQKDSEEWSSRTEARKGGGVHVTWSFVGMVRLSSFFIMLNCRQVLQRTV